MAVYKVIQDIEAEDKLLGPLTLKGFIYALTAGFLAFLNFKVLVMPSLGNFRWPIILVFGLPMLLFGVLASPLGREQPTEIWLLSRVRFFLKPRNRIWDQTGLSNLVTVTAPPKVDLHLTKELSQDEVQSRLQTLAATMDSRGWAVKNVNLNLASTASPIQLDDDSQRLISVANIQQVAPLVDVHPDDDIMDEKSNPVAKLFAGLIQKKDAQHKNELVERMQESRKATTAAATAQLPKQARRGQPAYHITKDDAELNEKFAAAEAAFHSEHPQKPPTSSASSDSLRSSVVTEESQADKLELAQSGNDLSVATIQKLANRQPRVEQIGPNEVQISLH